MSVPRASQQQALGRDWTLRWVATQANNRVPVSVVPGGREERGAAEATVNHPEQGKDGNDDAGNGEK